MPSRSVHLGIAILLAITLYFISSNFNLDIENYLFVMCIVTLLPDIFEPAINYNHRGFFHSKKVLKFLSTYVLGITFFLGLIFHGVFYICFGSIGYILHLLLDSTTYIGLPE